MTVYKAILFDLDGTLVDTMDLYKQAFNEHLKPYGKEVNFDNGKYGGTPVKEILKDIFTNQTTIPIEELTEEILKTSKELLLTKQIDLIPGVNDFLEKYKEEYLFAIGSGSQKEVITHIVKAVNKETYFKELISTHEVEKGKPHPDIWIEAAKRLNVKPSECIVVEDAISGMLGGIAAGMRVIGVVKDVNKEYPTKELYESFNDIKLC